ncbi:enoyl-CoA hydratase-related protein [Phenylobacterium sp. LjRoot219]|uniref:enoyl-CoA hydratase-related protein n=1 Tax=Phenylobacterium sp. LjRoot219 TaxID=3342283 RepID=UPI003ED04953
MSPSSLSPASDAPLLVSVEDGVARIILNRPERQNAWNQALGRAYFEALEALARDERARVIVVSGAGGAFCVGGDQEVLSGIAATGQQSVAATPAFWRPLTIGKPIIAAIAGPCFGLGLQAALTCDIRFAAENAKLSTAYVRRGVSAEMGMSWLLPRIVGVGCATDLLLSGRVVRAPEALRIGLVSQVFADADLEAEALAYARIMASQCSPRAMRTIKGQLYTDLTSDLPSAYGRAIALLEEAFASADFAEGVTSWRDRRPPAFSPLPRELADLDLDPPPGGSKVGNS